MPSPTYAKNKKFIYNWAAKHPDRVRELSKLSKRKLDAFKKERKRLFSILLD